VGVAKAANMAAPVVVSKPQWDQVMGAAKAAVMAVSDMGKAEAVVSRSRWAPVMGAAKVAITAVPDMDKAEGVVSTSRWDPATDKAETANEAVAPKTWLPLRRLRSRRGPSREENHRARRPLPD